MTEPRRVCFWTTSFQADNQALACYLAGRPGWDVTVAMDQPERYAAEPVNRLLPLPARVVDRQARGQARSLRREGFDLCIVDNHLPEEAIAPRLLVLWHGFGWRVDDLTAMRKELAALVGDVTRPNPRFRWQAFGEWDREYRIAHSRLAPENVVALGSAYSDLLLPATGPAPAPLPLPQPDQVRRLVNGAYPVELIGRRTVLLGLTWHHGAALAHWGDDAELLGRLFDHLTHRGANVVLRLHDRHRYDPAYLESLARLTAGRPTVATRFKSDHPDSLVDLLVSDVLVSNYSSLLNPFYYTRRPTVHLDPHPPGGRPLVYRRWKGGRLREERVGEGQQVWKLDPGEIGGFRAESFDAALEQLDRALAEPDCCAESAKRFTDRYITGADGRTRERMEGFLGEWMG